MSLLLIGLLHPDGLPFQLERPEYGPNQITRQIGVTAVDGNHLMASISIPHHGTHTCQLSLAPRCVPEISVIVAEAIRLARILILKGSWSWKIICSLQHSIA
jgi:hypothetical protein